MAQRKWIEALEDYPNFPYYHHKLLYEREWPFRDPEIIRWKARAEAYFLMHGERYPYDSTADPYPYSREAYDPAANRLAAATLPPRPPTPTCHYQTYPMPPAPTVPGSVKDLRQQVKELQGRLKAETEKLKRDHGKELANLKRDHAEELAESKQHNEMPVEVESVHEEGTGNTERALVLRVPTPSDTDEEYEHLKQENEHLKDKLRRADRHVETLTEMVEMLRRRRGEGL